MTIIDYLLLGGVAVAAGYVVYRLFIGWHNSSTDGGQMDAAKMTNENATPDRVASTGASSQVRTYS